MKKPIAVAITPQGHARALESISTAPKDGTTVLIRTWHGDVPAYYLECGWLNTDNEFIKDCWRPDHEAGAKQDSDIELKDALAWAPL